MQDFVRGGQWSDVGDLQNTGLYNIHKDFLGGLADFAPKSEDIKHLKKQQRMEALAKAIDAGDLPEVGYATRTEWEDAIRKHGRPTYGEVTDDLLRQLQPPQEGMKKGGKVSVSDNLDTMMMDMGDKHMAGGGVARKGIKALKLMLDPEVITPSARSATKFTEPTPHMSVDRKSTRLNSSHT